MKNYNEKHENLPINRDRGCGPHRHCPRVRHDHGHDDDDEGSLHVHARLQSVRGHALYQLPVRQRPRPSWVQVFKFFKSGGDGDV